MQGVVGLWLERNRVDTEVEVFQNHKINDLSRFGNSTCAQVHRLNRTTFVLSQTCTELQGVSQGPPRTPVRGAWLELSYRADKLPIGNYTTKKNSGKCAQAFYHTIY